MSVRDELSVLDHPARPVPVEWKLSHDLIPYPEALSSMEERLEAIIAGREHDLVWLLEHPPLLTSGIATSADDLAGSEKFPLYETGRGGRLTYHGPGQRIAYVMMDLKPRGADLRRYVASLEEWLIRTLAEFGVTGERREDRVGVWVKRPEKGEGFEDKIAAIGVRVKKWVTMHGISLNVAPDLSHYRSIVPCGVQDARWGVTSLRDLGIGATLPDVDAALKRQFAVVFGSSAKG